MSRMEVLKKLYDEAMNQVFAYSVNYLMSVPKKGFEAEWVEAKETACVLESLIQESA